MMLMRWLIAAYLAVAVLPGFAADDFQELKAKAEAAQGGKRAELFAKLAYEQVEIANQLFSEGRPSAGHEAVQQVVKYAEVARDAGLDAGSKLKKTELTLRKAARKLDEVRRTLAFEDRAPVGQAVERLHSIQDELLDAMFAPKRKAEDKS